MQFVKVARKAFGRGRRIGTSVARCYIADNGTVTFNRLAVRLLGQPSNESKIYVGFDEESGAVGFAIGDDGATLRDVTKKKVVDGKKTEETISTGSMAASLGSYFESLKLENPDKFGWMNQDARSYTLESDSDNVVFFRVDQKPSEGRKKNSLNVEAAEDGESIDSDANLDIDDGVAFEAPTEDSQESKPSKRKK